MPDPIPPTEFTVDMGDVCLALGIHPKQVRKLRRQHLVDGADFLHVANRCVFRPAAVEKLCALVRGAGAIARENAAEGGDSGKLVPPVLAPVAARRSMIGWPLPGHRVEEIHEAQVVSRLRDFGGLSRQHFPNPRVIRAAFLNDPSVVVFVRVGHSRNYAPKTQKGAPMVVRLRWTDDRWEAVGRDPRFPGKW